MIDTQKIILSVADTSHTNKMERYKKEDILATNHLSCNYKLMNKSLQRGILNLDFPMQVTIRQNKFFCLSLLTRMLVSYHVGADFHSYGAINDEVVYGMTRCK